MDPFTHALSGAVLSRTGFYQKYGRPATIILVAAALIPDIDHFSLRLAGPLAYLKYHRGFTHSIVGSFFLAALLAGIVYLIKKLRGKIDYVWAFILSLLGISTHIFFDLITSYGTQIFFPLSDKRYSLDLVFIIDLYFSSLLLIPLVIIRFKREKAKVVAITSLISIIVYLGFASVERILSIDRVKEENSGRGIEAIRVEAIPLPFSPFRWSVFTEDEERFYQTNVDNMKGTSTAKIFEKKRKGNSLVTKVEELEIVKTYLWFARFPIATIKEEGNGYRVEYFDLRFNSLPPRRPFLLQLFLDKNGTLKNAELFFHTIYER